MSCVALVGGRVRSMLRRDAPDTSFPELVRMNLGHGVERSFADCVRAHFGHAAVGHHFTQDEL